MSEEIYILNEATLSEWLEDISLASEKITKLLNLIESIFEKDNAVYVTSELENSPISSTDRFSSIYEYTFEGSDVRNGIDRDTHRRLCLIRQRLESLSTDELTSATISHHGNVIREVIDWTIPFIISSHFPDSKVICLLEIELNPTFSGEYDLNFNDSQHLAFILNQENQIKFHTRCLIKNCDVNEQEFFSFWEAAFPILIRGTELSFDKFQQSFKEALPIVLEHLSFLNDNFFNEFNECNRDFPTLMRLAESKHNVSFSNESTKTRSQKKLMQLRAVEWLSKVYICECHTKLDPRFGRIHFNYSIDKKLSPKMILVGIFTNHLET